MTTDSCSGTETLGLASLPAPPDGRTGWPWTEETPPIPSRRPADREWPRITVVTPSYNQAEFLEETIRSVLLQGYPNLEYMVIDGGSSDDSVEIIRKYEQWMTYWVSEPDNGQTDAINKGFARATGDIYAWINSDDIYYAAALQNASAAMEEDKLDVYCGAMDKVEIDVDAGTQTFVKTSTPSEGSRFHPFPILASGRRYDFHFFQPSMFWRSWVWERTGGLDERYDYVMDMEWFNRVLTLSPEFGTSEVELTRFTLHPGSKSQDFHHKQLLDRVRMYMRLSRLPGFRPVPCYKAAVITTQQALSNLASKADAEHSAARGFMYRAGARAIKVSRRMIPALRGDLMMPDRSAQKP